jgi:putative membrane protein
MKLFKWSLLGLSALAMSAFADKVKMTPDELLARLHDANQEEISLGKLATEKGELEQVKSYGAHLVQDHTAADNQVIALAKLKNINLNSTLPQSIGETGQLASGATTATELKILSGKPFDRAFIKAMRSDHDKVIRMIETAEIDDLPTKALAQKMLPQLKEHRRLAKNLQGAVKAE